MTGTRTRPAPASPSRRVILEELAPGTAVVAAAVVRPRETVLDLRYPGGRRVTVAVPGVQQRSGRGEGWSTTMRPVAVRMRSRQAALECSVLATTSSGPTRVRISLYEALTLCASGVHTVLSAE